MYKLIAAAAGVMAIVCVSVGSASAATPVVVVDDTFVNEFPVPAEDFECGVDAFIQETVKVRVTAFFDNDGNFVGDEAHLNGTTRVTTENGTAIDRWSEVDFFDPEDETVTTAGNPFNIQVPGSGTGVLVNDSGLITYDPETGEVLFIGGPHPAFFGPEVFDEVCALLGG